MQPKVHCSRSLVHHASTFTSLLELLGGIDDECRNLLYSNSTELSLTLSMGWLLRCSSANPHTLSGPSNAITGLQSTTTYPNTSYVSGGRTSQSSTSSAFLIAEVNLWISSLGNRCIGLIQWISYISENLGEASSTTARKIKNIQKQFGPQ